MIGVGVGLARRARVLALALTIACGSEGPGDRREPMRDPGERLSVAVLGDSDSHSYHDDLNLTPEQRGGELYRSTTLQWTEVLNRARGESLDFGRWGDWGVERYRFALVQRLLGWRVRYPRKRDFEYNMAFSAAVCSDLTRGPQRQVDGLEALFVSQPDRWSDGLVVIRVGINSVSGASQLDEHAAAGLTPESERLVDECVEYIREAVRVIRARQERMKIALVGIAEDIDGPSYAERWQSPEAVGNIREVLDAFDSRLVRLADADPHMVFVDDRRWFRDSFGGRDANGVVVGRALSLGGERPVTSSAGDHPSHAITLDGHAGTVANGLWANQLLRGLNDEFGLGLSPLLLAEIADLADPRGTFGIAPPREATAEGPGLLLPPTPIEVSEADLPYVVPGVRAVDANGRDVTPTLVAWIVGPAGRRDYLFGSGSDLELRRERHRVGRHEIVWSARDRNGRVSTARSDIRIRP